MTEQVLPEEKLFRSLSEKLEKSSLSEKKVSLGFDGFIDSVLYVVDKRIDAENYIRMDYMKQYGETIANAAGKSMNIEMFPVMQKIGGNGPILANSLKKLGCGISYAGAMGKNGINPAYEEMCGGIEAHSIADPAKTDAIEFLDGKIISSQLEALNDVCWEALKKEFGTDGLCRWIEQADLVSFVNWTLLVHMSEIWEGFQKEILPNMELSERKFLFIDLADPMKRTAQDIEKALTLVSGFEKYFRVVLGLNLREAQQLAPEKANLDPEVMAEDIRQRLQIEQVVVHPVKSASAATKSGSFTVNGPYCEHPVLTTGAGDNFNAGYVFGLLCGCSAREALLAGVANSGFYVRNGRSASLEELKDFLEQWKLNLI